jgi:hypothetical protein
MFEPLTNKTIKEAVDPWKNRHIKSHRLYEEIMQQFGHISQWDTSQVTDMSYLFGINWDGTGERFNQDISQWDVSNVTTMRKMFYSAVTFNQDLSQWNVSNVINMDCTFRSAYVFNQDLSQWNTINVRNMNYMFNGAYAFNQNISQWNVEKVLCMHKMFTNAHAFNQDISSWKILDIYVTEECIDVYVNTRPKYSTRDNDSMFSKTKLDEILHKCALKTPFNLPYTHLYHTYYSWKRRRAFATLVDLKK